VIGDVPVAAKVWLYAVPTVPSSRVVVVMVGATEAAFITMLNALLSLSTVLVAVTVKLKVPTADGVPVMPLG
jgi:hypothetical protein